MRSLFVCLPYLLLLAMCCSVFATTTDDPFITYRYARNLLAGHGPVYNVGERVEGFSSPLHLLLCVVLLKIAPGVGILFKAKIAGILFAMIAVYQTGRLGRLSGLGVWARLLAQVLVALNVNFALAAVNGLETTMAACVLLAALEVFRRECRGRGGSWSSTLMGAALLARPEMGLVFAGLLAVRLAWAWRRGLPVRRVVLWALPFAWLAGMLTLARLAYYGAPLPNTYYAKHVPIARGLSEGATYLLHPLSPLAVTGSDRLAFLGAAVFWLTALVGLWSRRGRMGGWVLGAVVIALVVFVLRAGGDWMTGWRFLVPALPVFAVLQCHGLGKLARRLRHRPPARLLAALAALALWGACAWADPHDSWVAARYARDDRGLLIANGPLGRKWVATAEYVRRTVAPGQTVAYSEMGYAGWVNPETAFCDMRGLTDREVSRLPDRFKGTFGVDDERWLVPGDPLFRILERRRPAMIVAFSHPSGMPGEVLGCYSLTAVVRDVRDSDAVIVPSLVYVSPDFRANEKPLTRTGQRRGTMTDRKITCSSSESGGRSRSFRRPRSRRAVCPRPRP